ncbi:glycosyltransferase family 4 protein [Paraburkholderia kururiensis]|uniref:glycosyltransferase family 4 protein n=1 Tax=Paraburkholderia kururiensis TaxID=984307 RepID=UPI0009DF5EEC|nr:glycosyltransferase family 1 protein [Paraburkholderia kururiensis]
MGGRVWLEISLLEHWGPKPHGIPRVSQNVFLQSLRRADVGHFFFDRARQQFIVPESTEYFVALAAGRARYSNVDAPHGSLLGEQLASGDRVLFSEAAWDHSGYLEAAQALRGKAPGVVMQFLLCDLIPVKFPHFFEPEFGSRAAAFMRALPTFCDRYACISRSTAADVKAILSDDADTRVFRLGSDVVDAGATPADEAAGGRPYVLSVGTIEIRKNHVLLYYVWRRLAALLGERCPKLILVGRQGWIAGDVYTLFQTDPAVRGLVEIRHDVTNEKLAALISGSLFTVFPSFYEGWGLPASESLFYGKVCVTSNTSSLPEINPFPELMFDPYDHQQAFEIISGLVQNPDLLCRFEEQIHVRFQRQTWENSFDDLMRSVEA